MQPMTREQWWQLASTGTRTGHLALAAKDGSTRVVPIWFLLDDSTGVDEVVFTTYTSSLKGKILRRDPRFALCVDSAEPPYDYVQLRGNVTLLEDVEQVRTWAGRLAARYMGDDLAEQYAERNGVPGELLVRGRIEAVSAFSGLAD